MSEHKESPADICLNRKACAVYVKPSEDLMHLDDDLAQMEVTVEHRAWVCPYCEQASEYWLVNGMVEMGRGKMSLASNGKISDCCGRPKCREAQDRFHGRNQNIK